MLLYLLRDPFLQEISFGTLARTVYQDDVIEFQELSKKWHSHIVTLRFICIYARIETLYYVQSKDMFTEVIFVGIREME